MWVIENAKQWITFIDPHGLRYAEGGFNDSKIRLHADLKALEPTVQQQCTQWQVYLTSFILSTSRYDEIKMVFPRPHSQEEFEKHNILFIYDDPDYIRKLLRTVLEEASTKA